MIKAVLFDLDGTLANSLYDLTDATNFALKEFGFPTRQTEEFKLFAGDGMPKMIERALPEGCKSDETVKRIMPVFLDYYGIHYCDKTKIYDGMIHLIDTLKVRGLTVAVVTNKAQNMAEKVVNKLYGNRFDLVFGKKDLIPPKPDPTAALMSMKLLNVTPEECIFVGDSKVDVMTGINSGAYPVGVLWGFRSKDELISGGAKKLIKEPKELLEIIDKLG